jgi:hypothetical protein
MNKERRAEIAAVMTRLAAWKDERDSIHDAIDSLAGEESDYFDNMPESLQGGDKGTRAEEARDALYEARDAFDGIDVEEIESALERASE